MIRTTIFHLSLEQSTPSPDPIKILPIQYFCHIKYCYSIQVSQNETKTDRFMY